MLDAIFHFFRALYHPEGLKELIRSGGAPLICAIVFVETGFFVGFFLPGDSLLVTAGIFSAAGVIPLKWLLLPVMACAIVGDQIGYWIGRSAGAALYRREDSFFFRRQHLQKAHDFYEKYGGRAVILARFIPIIRTFCPPVAGAAKMPYPRYLIFDVFGGIFWVAAMILGGYSLGKTVPNIGQRIHYVISVVIVLSVLPAVVSILRSRQEFRFPKRSEPASGKIRAIIFDIGRVLIQVDIGRAMKGLTSRISLSPEELWKSLENDPRWKDWQEGRMSPREWFVHLVQRLEGSLTGEQFTECWNLALDPEPIFDDAFLKGLSENYRLALLSNTDRIHVAHIEANYSFVKIFHTRIYSCSVGTSKPDPLIYQLALRGCRVNAEEAVYIDDIPAYVEAARKLGLKGIVFQSPEQLKTDLQSLGILTE